MPYFSKMVSLNGDGFPLKGYGFPLQGVFHKWLVGVRPGEFTSK